MTVICKDCGAEAEAFLYFGVAPEAYEPAGYIFCQRCLDQSRLPRSERS